jgi:thiamine transport system permease protein
MPRALLVVPILFLALFYAWPLGVILARSAQAGSIGAAFVEARTWSVVGFTLWQALLSTAVTVAVGLPGAYLIGRYEFPGRRWLRILSGIPFVMPTVVVGAAFVALLGPTGLLNLGLTRLFALDRPPLPVLESLGAIVLGHVFYNTTIVIRLVGDAWAALDPRLVAAARVLGARRSQAFWRIDLPLLWPSLLTAALLVFMFDVTSFGVVLILGGARFSTLETEIYRQALSFFNLPMAAALTVIQMVITLVVTGLYSVWTRRPEQLRGRSGARPTLRPIRGRGPWLAWVFTATLVLAVMTAPLIALVVRSLLAPDGGLTFAYYAELNINRRQSAFFVPATTALANSLVVAAATTVIATGLGLATAVALRTPSRLGRWFEAGLLFPLGTSAVTLGLGYLLAFSRPPLAWRAEPWLLPVVHALIAFPFVVRSLLPAIRAIAPGWRRAAATLGASPARVVWTIDLPIMARSVAVAAAFAFAISLGEFGATALLSRPDFPTLPVAIFNALGQPGALNYGQALAMSTLLMLLCAAVIGVIEDQGV